MANTDAPNGFTPARHLTGGTIRMEEYPIQSGASGDTTGIFSGDVMTQDTDGYVDLAATTEAVLGIFAGCSYTATTGEKIFAKNLPANTTTGSGDITAYIYSDPMIVYRVQHNAIGAFADNNSAFDSVIGAGNTKTGRSAAELNTSTKGVSGQWRQLGLVKTDDNAWGANAEVEVVAYEHVYSGAVGTPTT